jgi:hypothetical protein
MVFLNTMDFAEIADVEYYRRGYSAEPDRLRIPIMVDTDATDDGKWQKNSQRQKAGSTIMYQKDDMVLYKVNLVIYAALEDFGQHPKRGRRMTVFGKTYLIAGVELDTGILRINLQEMDE